MYCVAVFTYGAMHQRKIAQSVRGMNLYEWSALVFTGIIAGFMTNLVFYKLLSITNTAMLTTLVKLSPIVTAILTYYFLGEPVSFQMIGGIFIVVIGLMVMTSGSNLKS